MNQDCNICAIVKLTIAQINEIHYADSVMKSVDAVDRGWSAEQSRRASKTFYDKVNQCKITTRQAEQISWYAVCESDNLLEKEDDFVITFVFEGEELSYVYND